MVTAELVEPLDNGTVRPMPGELHETPNDWELFMEGSLAGATKAGKPLARLKVLGLEGLRGPGALRRPDDPRVSAADVFPATPTANFEMNGLLYVICFILIAIRTVSNSSHQFKNTIP